MTQQRLHNLLSNDSPARAARLAGALFAAILAWRFAASDPVSAVGSLYVVPIALLAVRFGTRGGLVGATIGSSLIVLWTTVEHVQITPSGYLVRFVSFFAVALIVGWQVESRHHVEREADRWFSMSNELCCVASFDGYYTRVNQAWTDSLGYSREELLETPYVDFVHPDDLERTRVEAAALEEPGHSTVTFENRYRATDGSWHWLLWSSRSDGTQVYASARDITERKKLEQKLESLASEDKLTGIANRRAWEERFIVELRRAARSGEPLQVAMVDLDDLKAMNDAQGHAAGDRLLRASAAAWTSAVRETDFVARLGGDEFGVLLPNCTEAGAEEVAERMCQAMPDGSSCSIGVAQWDGAEFPAETLARADDALYAAKAAGRKSTVPS